MNRRNLPLESAFLVVLLATATLAQSQVVAVGQQRLLAAWNVTTGTERGLYAGLSDFTGKPDGALVRLSENASPSRPAVATDGERFLVVWPEVVNEKTSIRAAIVGEKDFVIAAVVDLAPEKIAPVALWTGSAYVVFWQTAAGTDVALITANGVVESTRAVAGVGRVVSAALGAQPVMLWLEGPLGIRLHAAVLGSDWNPIDVFVVATMPESIGGGSTFIIDPQIGWNGSSFYVTWTAGRAGRYVRIEGSSLSVDGQALDTNVTCELGPPGTCGNNTRIAGSLIYSGCCTLSTDGLLPAHSRFVKAWVGPSLLSSHDHQAVLIDDHGSPSAPFRLEPAKFPPYFGVVAVLPNGELVIVSIVNNGIDVQRVGLTRRRAVRSS
jgi:hypothetical protein